MSDMTNYSMELADRIAQHTHPAAFPCGCQECGMAVRAALRATDDRMQPMGDGVNFTGGDA